jgi:hypothetical protein
MNPAGLRNSGLPSKPMRIQLSSGRASRTLQPRSCEQGGVVMASSAVEIIWILLCRTAIHLEPRLRPI